MPSFEQQVENNQIIIVVAVRLGSTDTAHYYKALLDTGAQVTAIAPKVVDDLKLTPIRPLKLTVASGEEVKSFQYRARVYIPINYNTTNPPGAQPFLMGNQLTVAGLPYQPDGYDVLLGMDLIGSFHMTIYRNRIILSN